MKLKELDLSNLKFNPNDKRSLRKLENEHAEFRSSRFVIANRFVVAGFARIQSSWRMRLNSCESSYDGLGATEIAVFPCFGMKFIRRERHRRAALVDDRSSLMMTCIGVIEINGLLSRLFRSLRR